MPSWQDPPRTLDTNIQGTYHILQAIKKADIDPVIQITCSSAEYGLNYPHEIPVTETKEFRPSSPYGVSKVGTDMLSYLYGQGGMKIIRTRPFNITGPRKTLDATSDFAQGVAAVEAGLLNEMSVGNLDSIRDITDYRDGIKAMWLLSEKGKPDEIYNLGAQSHVRVSFDMPEYTSDIVAQGRQTSGQRFGLKNLKKIFKGKRIGS